MATKTTWWMVRGAVALAAMMAIGCGAMARAVEPNGGAPALELGDMQVTEDGQPMLKLHADGRIETTAMSNGAEVWRAGPVLQQDGSILLDGETRARILPDGSIEDLKSGEVLRLQVSADRVTLERDGKEIGLALAADGLLTPIGVERKPTVEWRVAGAKTPGQRKTMLTVIGMMLLTSA